METFGRKDKFSHSKYLVHQKHLAISEKYFVFDENGNKLFFVERPFFKLKRHTYIYDDETKVNKVLSIMQDKIFELFSSDFTVLDANENVIGKLRRLTLLSIFRRKWIIFNSQGMEIGKAEEDSLIKAIVRRFLPLGEFLKTDFNIYIEGNLIGKFLRKWTILDKYVLDLTLDNLHRLDRKLAVALAIMLDTAEKR